MSESAAILSSHGDGRHPILAVLFYNSDAKAILQKAASIAKMTRSKLMAVFIQPYGVVDSSTLQKVRTQALYEARQAGASSSVLHGKNPARVIAEFASLYHCSQIVLGSGMQRKSRNPFATPLFRHLQQMLPEEVILVVPENEAPDMMTAPSLDKGQLIFRDFLVTFLIMLAATALGLFIDQFSNSEAAIIPIFSLAILLVALASDSWKTSVIASVVSIFLYNYLFAQPRLSLAVANLHFLFIYMVMLMTSIAIGLLVSSMKKNTALARETAYKTRLLFDSNELLQMAGSESEIIDILCQQSRLLSNRNVIYYPWDGQNLGDVRIYSMMDGPPASPHVLLSEKQVAYLCADTGEISGYGSLNPGNADYLYLPCKTMDRTMGVLGIEMKNANWDDLESEVIQTLLTKSALSLENITLSKQMEEARIQARNEEMRSNLLRMISHDLRTPLTSILGNVSNLMIDTGTMKEDDRRDMYEDMYDNTTWLIKLVENLLSASRLEEGTITIHSAPDILEEAINEGVNAAMPLHCSHEIHIQHDEDYILVDMDASMIIRVISNIVSNAIEYTPEGSHILVHSFIDEGFACVEISDDGPGIDDEAAAGLFGMFYSSNRVSADSRKNLGLGLFLCQKIIQAHKGTIRYKKLDPHGSSFEFRLPLSDLSVIHD